MLCRQHLTESIIWKTIRKERIKKELIKRIKEIYKKASNVEKVNEYNEELTQKSNWNVFLL